MNLLDMFSKTYIIEGVEYSLEKGYECCHISIDGLYTIITFKRKENNKYILNKNEEPIFFVKCTLTKNIQVL